MNYDEKICVIKKRSDTGDFVIDFAFGRTVTIEHGTEDWEDIDLFLKWHSPSGMYERTEVKQ